MQIGGRMRLSPGSALALVVLIWGSSPLVVVSFREALPPALAASVVVLTGALIVCSIDLAFRRRLLQEIRQVDYTAGHVVKLFSAACLGFVVYPICYFTALHSEVPIEANVLNYTWPLVAVVVCLLARAERASPERILGILLGFYGALLAFRSLCGVLPLLRSTGAGPSVSIGSIVPILMALLGAVSYGTYTALLRGLTLQKTRGGDVSPQCLFFLILCVAGALHGLILLGSLGFGADWTFRFSRSSVMALLLYAGVNLACAHLLWLYVVPRMPLSRSTVAIYLTPVVSTIGLSVVFNLGINDGTLCGLSLILGAIYLSRYESSFMSPMMAALLAIFLSWSLFLPSPVVSIDGAADALLPNDTLAFVEILTAVFAILSSFILTRAIGHHVRVNRGLLALNGSLARAWASVGNSQDAGKAIDLFRMHLVDEYVSRAGIATSTLYDTPPHKGAMDHLDDALSKEAERLNKAAEARTAICDLRQRVGDWQYLVRERVSNYEWFILVAITIVLIVLSFLSQWQGVFFQIGRTAFISALVLIGFAIRDYDVGRPGKMVEFILRLQEQYRFLSDGRAYVPPMLLARDFVPSKLRDRSSGFRSRDGSGRIVTTALPRLEHSRLPLEWLVLILIAATVGFATVRRYLVGG